MILDPGVPNSSSSLRIAAGAYYESHQQLRVIAARYLKQSNYDAAADILAGGAQALLKAPGASASGGDLAIMLVKDVYNKAEWEATDDEAGRKRKRTLDVLRTPYDLYEIWNLHHKLVCLYKAFRN